MYSKVLEKGGGLLFEESIKLAIRSRYTKNPLSVAQRGFDQTYYWFLFLFLLLKSRDEWTFEVMDSGIKYKIKKGKAVGQYQTPAPNLCEWGVPWKSQFLFIGHILIFVVGSSCPGCMPFGWRLERHDMLVQENYTGREWLLDKKSATYCWESPIRVKYSHWPDPLQ